MTERAHTGGSVRACHCVHSSEMRELNEEELKKVLVYAWQSKLNAVDNIKTPK